MSDLYTMCPNYSRNEPFGFTRNQRAVPRPRVFLRFTPKHRLVVISWHVWGHALHWPASRPSLQVNTLRKWRRSTRQLALRCGCRRRRAPTRPSSSPRCSPSAPTAPFVCACGLGLVECEGLGRPARFRRMALANPPACSVVGDLTALPETHRPGRAAAQHCRALQPQ
eukprot:1144906-Prymnesium_polylepis.2